MNESKIYKTLMTMTEAEEAAMEFLRALDEAREGIREFIDRREAT